MGEAALLMMRRYNVWSDPRVTQEGQEGQGQVTNNQNDDVLFLSCDLISS